MQRRQPLLRTLLAGGAILAVTGCAGLQDPDYFSPLDQIEPAAGPAANDAALALASAVIVGDLIVGGQAGQQMARAASGMGAIEPAAGPDEALPGDPIVVTDDASPDRQARRLAAFTRLAENERRLRRMEADKAILLEHWMRSRVEPLPMERGDVRRTQQLLAVLGYLDGPVDGLYGPQTRGAVERFETAAGLPTSGMVTPALVERLALEL